ncbi:beta-1,4-glucuronyltransferase 1 isoform X1 [Dermatophagoides farinae]|uniref:beta-1,4-glucuronyltransferase 1 isoform X1 n=1 Tax=Dermatophagoides farinae TaxID=6954 RepID=UPI003F6309C7
MFKWRYLRNFRLDSHYILKILIIFNILLGLYLLFLSTNYRRYVEYPHDSQNNDKPTKVMIKDGIDENHQINDAKIINKKVDKIVEPQQQSRQENPDNTIVMTNDKNIKSNDQSVDKVFDSNNRPVQIQDVGQNNADASYKRVEEDEKIIDESDKLKIEMLGAKPDEQNSIIHMDLDSFTDGKNDKANDIMSEAKDNNRKDLPKESLDDLLNKDVIKQIMDHNSHIKKNYSQLIVPDNINLEPSSWTTETRGKYQALKNYIIGNGLIDYSRTITLSTQGGPGFLHHAEQLCSRWDGPISLAVYAPGEDFRLSVNMIYYLRQCAHECVAKRVFWHFVYDIAFPPSAKMSGPTSFLKTNKFDCSKSLDETMKMLKIDTDFRSNKSLPYPINVLRNVARSSSKSKYLLASDIELYPNIGIIPAFFDLLDREQKGLVPVINVKFPHVYVLPIFEVKATKQPPKTKQELSKLFKSKDSIFFHRYVCDECQNFPDRNIWINDIPKNNTMNIFRVTKRTHDRNQWEPLYIGTNDEPFYDERLTWEGKRDKMSQMYQMCLMNYDLLILDNAFLVHAPGIKRYHPKDDQKRLVYIKYNHQIYTSTLAELRKKYGNKNYC